jgi:hypothetical protein
MKNVILMIGIFICLYSCKNEDEKKILKLLIRIICRWQSEIIGFIGNMK